MPPIRATQAAKFEAMMDRVLRTNAFYRSKYASLSVSPDRPPRLSDLATLPYTTKTELSADQRAYPLFGTNLTEPIERYTRVHRTSGTTGRPLYWLDTGASWQWFIDCWKEVYAAAGVNSEDRVFVAFSFGPFIGFWAAFEAAQEIGALAIPGGGMSSKQRLDSMRELDATVLVCTPTYALRLAERARQEALVLVDLPVRVTIHAGEPGASLPNVKARLEKAWGARCLDHAGATELGPWGYGCGHPDHMHINESEFCVEVIDPDTLCAAALDSDDKGAFRAGELVMTNLGRSASPLIRYRTGDLVELGCEPCACGRPSAYLRGGVLGRLDDMLIVRGVNLFPSALENIVRGFDSIDEFEVHLGLEEEMTELLLRIELIGGEATETTRKLQERVQDQLMVRPRIEVVENGSLPRYELKSKRFKQGCKG